VIESNRMSTVLKYSITMSKLSSKVSSMETLEVVDFLAVMGTEAAMTVVQ